MKLLYTYEEAGAELGLHRNDISRLVKLGKLKAVSLVVRGKGKVPRKRIKGTELKRFIDSLGGEPEPSPAPVARRGKVAKLLAESEVYEAV